ncbi:ABC transporter ATP-binding protein [Streptococcus constellatus subsp. pharyngis]|uniref:ABC-type multidrug transport system, ATPase component n=3 Tax=Streptococcus constellatus TaxID=76860 RepID=U2XY74_STRCV|nr:ABC transporter ATP-binding protein [Streptococcus constellatus]BAO73273.1 SagG protein [Streptococcus constellatus subsp. pharyngis]BAO73291.1 SagG protein [Streptococcus constellatus subsp. viborgensis SK1359]AGU72236.1 streptolysin S export protein SagG [Streptococcus constellatus subsp. pharyngis C232]AGU73992.1 streptolysin S export protein SagG [Streptococcus constellatus subsp. pharyngis C818]AGU79360.1 streptolysin S export protein SagG [Streptococcus constellatus subsp. pharyngis C
MSLVELTDVTKVYSGGKTAVDHVSFSLEKKGIYGLLGPNGAGKSSLINLILGLTPTTSGKISLFGQSIKAIKKVSSKIGYVPQDIAIYPDLTAYENVELFGSLYGLKGATLKEKVLESLEFVGLTDQAKNFPRQFSGGMKRRLNIACALVHSPQLIIFDEPTVGIDPQSRNHILESIRLLNDRGTTVIYTTHYMEEVEALCDYIYIMDHGKVIEEGSVGDLEKRYEKDFAQKIMVTVTDGEGFEFVHESNWKITELDHETIITVENESIQTVIEKLNRAHIRFSEIRHTHLNLEEIFLHLTGKKLRD